MKKDALLFGRRPAYVLFLLALLCAACAVLYVAVRIPLEDTRLLYTQPTPLTEGWAVQYADGEVPLAEPSRPAAGSVGVPLRLVHTLPQPLEADACLCFQTKNESVRVWADGELIYDFGETPQRAYGFGVGALWHLAALPPDAAAVCVELTPIGGRTGLAPYTFLLGARDGLIAYLLRERMAVLVICLLQSLIGLAAMAASAMGAFRRERWAGAAFNFSLFALLSAVWTITDSGLLQFVIANKGVIYMMFGCSFYLLCTPFALFMACMEPEHQRPFRMFAVLNAVYALLRILLYVTGRLDFEAGLWILHLWMCLLILFTNLTLWLPVIRTKKLERPALCLAVSAYTVVAAVSLLVFYMGDKLDVQRNGYSSGFYVGILIFILICCADAVRQAQLIRQQAFKADFYERRAYTDELTGLMNVKGFDDKCALRLREPVQGCCAVVDFDVNYFSQYNANNGLDAGDELLKAVAETLRKSCRPDELCARQEADHFVCMLCDDTLAHILARIREADRLAREGMRARMLHLSYGVVEVTDRELHPTALRNQALVAKRTVKGNYENNIAVYDYDLHEEQLREMELLSGLEAALEHDEYIIFLQPKIDVATEKIAGAEALVRHIGPDGAIMSAGPIIEALERKGYVAKLDFYILEQVCQFLCRALAAGGMVFPVSSNFSRVHLYDPTFPARVAAIVDQYALPHTLVEVELTETAFLAGKDALRDTVDRLHDYGFRVSIDDFGSGYSSLNMLKDVDVDTVKLDREFLADFAKNRRAGTIIEHTIRLVREMEITVVAEGIETAAQLAFLRRHGCDLVQGYYYDRPLPEDMFAAKYLAGKERRFDGRDEPVHRASKAK